MPQSHNSIYFALAPLVLVVSCGVASAADWLWVEKCRQDYCFKTWVTAKSELTESIYLIKSKGFEGPIDVVGTGEELTSVFVVSCAPEGGFVESTNGYRVAVAEDTEAVHADEDQVALWNAVCKNKYETVR